MATFFVDAIDELVENKKVVYIGINYAIDYREWAELLNPPDNHVRYNTLVENLVIFLKKHKISGVIMRGLHLYVSIIIMLIFFMGKNNANFFFINKLL